MKTQPGLKIVVEGPDDARLIRAILGKDLANRVRIFGGQGQASLATVGRNLLFHEGGPVLLVMDANTLDPQLAAECKAMNMLAMRSALTSGGQFPLSPEALTAECNVFTFLPTIQVVFFEAPQALDRLLGKRTPPEKIKEGQFVPQQTLAELLDNGKAPRDYQSLLADIDAQVQQAIASGRQAKALKEIVESMLAAPVEA